MNTETVSILQLIHDSNFSKLWKKSSEHAMTWDMYRQETPPVGYSIENTYAIITALRRCCSIQLPFDNYILDVNEPYNWFSMTNDMHKRLIHLVAQGQAGSHLDLCLHNYVSGQSKVLFLVDEYLSLARRDGLILRSDDVCAIWNRVKVPKTSEDRLAYNFASIITKINRYQTRKISQGLIEEIHEELLCGVTFESYIPQGQSRITSRKTSSLDDSNNALAMVVALANGKNNTADIHPIFRSMLMSGIFWEFFPLEGANALVEFIVRNIFYAKEGLSVLGWVSFSRISEQWEQGRLNKPNVLCRYLEAFPDCGEGFDATSHFATELQIMQYELEYLQEKLATVYQEDRSARAILERERYLNNRQRDTLLFSARNPGCQHTIADQKRLYGVVYATARQDLLELVDMGFLSQYKRGRAFVFEATPRFYDFIKDHR